MLSGAKLMQSGSTVYIYSEGGIRSFLSTDRHLIQYCFSIGGEKTLHGLHTVNFKRAFS